MKSIFPPTGDQDAKRYATLTRDERTYMWFCLEFCGQVLSRRPNHVEALEMAANHLTALGYYADGLKIDRRLSMLKPEDPGVWYNLACSLALVGSHEEALEQLTRAVDSGYNDFHHMSNDKDLLPLQGDPRFLEILARTARQGRLI